MEKSSEISLDGSGLDEGYVYIDTPGKIKTLNRLKYLIVTLILLIVAYGFLFDKWKLEEPSIRQPMNH